MKKVKWNKIVAIIVICLNALLLFKSIFLFYMYNFTDWMFLFTYPDWVLYCNALLAIVGIYISMLVYKEKITIKYFVIATIAIWLIALKNYSVF